MDKILEESQKPTAGPSIESKSQSGEPGVSDDKNSSSDDAKNSSPSHQHVVTTESYSSNKNLGAKPKHTPTKSYSGESRVSDDKKSSSSDAKISSLSHQHVVTTESYSSNKNLGAKQKHRPTKLQSRKLGFSDTKIISIGGDVERVPWSPYPQFDTAESDSRNKLEAYPPMPTSSSSILAKPPPLRIVEPPTPVVLPRWSVGSSRRPVQLPPMSEFFPPLRVPLSHTVTSTENDLSQAGSSSPKRRRGDSDDPLNSPNEENEEGTHHSKE